MSKLFFDNLLELDPINSSIKKVSSTKEEAIELWGVVDEIVHHRVFGCVLEHLPQEDHKEFLKMFHKSPGDEKLLEFLKDKIQQDVALIIKESVAVLVLELTKDLETGKLVK